MLDVSLQMLSPEVLPSPYCPCGLSSSCPWGEVVTCPQCTAAHCCQAFSSVKVNLSSHPIPQYICTPSQYDGMCKKSTIMHQTFIQSSKVQQMQVCSRAGCSPGCRILLSSPLVQWQPLRSLSEHLCTPIKAD